ncbi:dihydrolipoyl dehydrogenase [Mycoplasma sp. 1331]|uniref:Dihydrolipoyl dehydrogenase n=1 Tax=Mycoplasma tauri TaxID=547987 RepID=A0A953NCE2_9MOLU|nr:dihydrolipoyl dehydrogenase [Mycoplasma tauri]MBZ4195291.1 dihydrolipoyl dehydrogenase [Mycoplasma tauri]
MKHFDVVIIGGGPGGYPLAILLSKKGKNVAIIERKNLGGTCVNWGCIPSKTLIKSAKVYETILKSDLFGINVDNFEIDFQKVQKRRQDNKLILNNKIKQQLVESGVKIFNDEAKLLDKNTIALSNENITFEKLVIATGSRARLLNLPGFEEALKNKDLIVASDALELTKIPKNLNIIGGGPVALEMAYLYSTLGSEVTIIESNNFMKKYDSELADAVKKYLMDKNIKIYENSNIIGFRDKKLEINIDNKTLLLSAEKTLIAVGRIPNIEAFKALNLEINNNGFIKVNEKMQTSIDNIYALGDVTGLMQLSSVAYRTSDIVAREILNLKSKPINLKQTGWSVYLNPEFSGIGFTEEELKEKKIDYTVVKMPATGLPRSLADGIDNPYGFIKLLVKKETHEILGAFMFIEGSHLLINQIAIAMQNNITIDDFQNVAFTHPTVAESLYYSWKMNSF